MTRCSACGGQLDLPGVHFMCRHSYHQRCVLLSLFLSRSGRPEAGPDRARARADASARTSRSAPTAPGRTASCARSGATTSSSEGGTTSSLTRCAAPRTRSRRSRERSRGGGWARAEVRRRGPCTTFFSLSLARAFLRLEASCQALLKLTRAALERTRTRTRTRGSSSRKPFVIFSSANPPPPTPSYPSPSEVREECTRGGTEERQVANKGNRGDEEGRARLRGGREGGRRRRRTTTRAVYAGGAPPWAAGHSREMWPVWPQP